jgi:hypothetical protein
MAEEPHDDELDLEAQEGQPLPDREMMSLITTDMTKGAIAGIGPSDPGPQLPPPAEDR